MPSTPPEEPHFFEQRLRYVLAMLESTVNEVQGVLDHFKEGGEDGPADPQDDAA